MFQVFENTADLIVVQFRFESVDHRLNINLSKKLTALLSLNWKDQIKNSSD